ncbi:abscisic acid responsive elements-binding factor 2 isoform X2 [Wolffia australiana]
MNSKSMGSDGKDHPTAGTPALARQSSVYALTFEEFQNSLGSRGKDFGSMNMDEFLKSVWSVEENQTAANEVVSTIQNLQRQGSLTLPETMSRKTVDEVWRDMFKDGGSLVVQNSAGPPVSAGQRQPTLGEITLEEFLLKAGVTWEEPVAEPKPVIHSGSTRMAEGNAFFGNASSSGFDANSGLALGFGNSSLGGNQVGTSSSIAVIGPSAGGAMSQYSGRGPLSNTGDLVGWPGLRTGGIMGNNESTVSNGLILGMSDLGRTVDDSPGSNVPSDGMGNSDGNLLGLSPSPTLMDRGLRRRGNGIVEKVVERRQRRMIKNRESAARSRARKQAYTLELEAEIAKLKKQNEELLKKQVEILEMQKKQKKADRQHQPKKPCLRRTTSWPMVERS